MIRSGCGLVQIRTFKFNPQFLWDINHLRCATSYNSELKLDSEFRCKYPQSIVCQNEETDRNKLLEMEQKYEAAISSEPESNTFCLLADIQYKLGKVDKATGVLIRGLLHHSNNATAHFLLGKIYFDRWLIDKAKKEMEKVLEIAPDNLEASNLLSQIYKSEDKLPKALETLEAAHIFHSDDPEILDRIERIKNEISDMELESSRKVFKTPPGSRKVNIINTDENGQADEVYTETILNLYLCQGKYDEARETIEHLYKSEEEKKAAIENLEKTKLNKMNAVAGFVVTD